MLWTRMSGMAVALALLLSGTAGAQVPPASPPVVDDQGQPPDRSNQRGRRNVPPGGVPAGDVLTTEQVYTLLDAFVMARAQSALQLNDGQWAPFVQRLLKLQGLQRMHRNQRQRMLRELRQLVGPNAPQNTDDAAITAKTKQLDDLEAQIAQDQQKAVGDIDQVLTVRQRAFFRVFLENMERQKLDLLVKARQRATLPPPAPVAAGRGQ
jgi:Spy/CpxP family protein refolding chaperone